MKTFLKEWLPLVLFTIIGVAMIGTAVFFLVRAQKGVDAFDNPARFRIEAGGTGIGVALVTDRDTGVQYLMNTNTGTCTVLVDKDGKPYLANGWRDYD